MAQTRRPENTQEQKKYAIGPSRPLRKSAAVRSKGGGGADRIESAASGRAPREGNNVGRRPRGDELPKFFGVSRFCCGSNPLIIYLNYLELGEDTRIVARQWVGCGPTAL